MRINRINSILDTISALLFLIVRVFNKVIVIALPVIILLLFSTGSARNCRIGGWMLFFWILLLPTFGIHAKTKCIKKLPLIFNVIWLMMTAIISFSYVWFSQTIGTSIQNILSYSFTIFLLLLYPTRLMLPSILSPWKSSFDRQVSGELLQVIPNQAGISIRSYTLCFKGDSNRYIVHHIVGEWYMRMTGTLYTYNRYRGAFGMIYIKKLRKVKQ